MYTYFQEMWSWGIKKNGISQGIWFYTEIGARGYCDRMNNKINSNERYTDYV